MKIFAPLLLAATAFIPAYATDRGYDGDESNLRGLMRKGGKKGSKGGNMGMSSSSSDDGEKLTLTIVNESFNQPFSGFFVMVHNSETEPLYRRGQPSSDALATLAEDGNPGPLVDYYSANNDGVLSAGIFNSGAPYFGGETLQIEVEVTDYYPLVTIATMAINTNDCFTSINGARLYSGQVLDLPGLDAGSEENNEQCNSIPGPGCADISSDNVRSLNGEGFVHVHRGFFGIGSLPNAIRYDWRNPMMRVVVN